MLKRFLLSGILGLLMMGCAATVSTNGGVEVDVDEEPEPMVVTYEARQVCCDVYLHGVWVYDMGRWHAHHRHHEWSQRREQRQRTYNQRQQHTAPPVHQTNPAPVFHKPAPVVVPPRPVHRQPAPRCGLPGLPKCPR